MAGPENRVPDALFRDPPTDAAAPAQTLPQAIPSYGVNLNAVLYTAAGAGPHPTILLLHGLPGNKQNVDLAQAMRRAGWNVLIIHYGGSWGGPGTFSFAHCLEDAASALDWLRSADGDCASRVNPRRIVVIGHSMGGFVAAHLLAEQPDVLGAGLISGVDLGRSFGNADKRLAVAEIDENVGSSAGLHILAGTSPLVLTEEARANAERWSLRNYAAQIAGRPLLMATSDDGFAADSDALANALGQPSSHVQRQHFSTDHSYSDQRIGLQTFVLGWLATHYPGA